MNGIAVITFIETKGMYINIVCCWQAQSIQCNTDTAVHSSGNKNHNSTDRFKATHNLYTMLIKIYTKFELNYELFGFAEVTYEQQLR